MQKKIIPTESQEQQKAIEYCHLLGLNLAYSTQNGVWLSDRSKSYQIAAKQRKEGLLKGLPDLCLPYPQKKYHGFYIEMKRVKGGVVSPEQLDIIKQLEQQGYYVAVCRGFEEAKKEIDNYFSGYLTLNRFKSCF